MSLVATVIYNKDEREDLGERSNEARSRVVKIREGSNKGLQFFSVMNGDSEENQGTYWIRENTKRDYYHSKQRQGDGAHRVPTWIEWRLSVL